MTSIIIVNYNTAQVLRECVESVYRFENLAKFEIIIIDNASNDNSKETIKTLSEKHPNLSCIFLVELRSFSFANNRGIEKAKGDFILIMNPDIIFTEPLLDKLSALISKDTSIGAVTPALIGSDGHFQRNYFQRYPTIRQFIFYHSVFAKLFNRSAKRMNKYLENQDINAAKKELFYVEQIPCAFFFTTKRFLNDMELMDEKFILFYEDVDLSYRVHKTNKLAVDTSMRVIHLGGSSFKSAENWNLHGRFIISMVYFFEKHYSPMRRFMLKTLVSVNSYFILFTENIKGLFGRKDEYRYKKHSHLLKLLKEDN